MSLFNPGNLKVGGKLVDNVEAICTFDTQMFDYNGTQPVPSPSVHMHGEVISGDSEPGTEFDEYYSVGDAATFRPNADHTYFDLLKPEARISDGSKAASLFVALQNIGLDPSRFTENVGDLNGTYKLIAKRESRTFKDKTTGQKVTKESRILLPVAISDGSKKKGAAKGNGKAQEKATAAVTALIAEKGVIPISQLGPLVFGKVKSDTDAQAIVKAAILPEFYQNGPWSFENGVLSASA